jgi:hypothetical protein
MSTLQNFLQTWDENYVQKLAEIDLFHESVQNSLNQNQKRDFVRVLYHARGHFYRFLWILGSLAPSQDFKKIVLDNIAEEFGGKSTSHETLYIKFAKEFEVDILQESVDEIYYLDCVKKFNHSHVQYITSQSWTEAWSAFAAYERLDNIDYAKLQDIAKNIGSSRSGLGFFIIHIKAAHFESTEKLLEEMWNKSPEMVKAGFVFIMNCQLEMWKGLSDYVLSVK